LLVVFAVVSIGYAATVGTDFTVWYRSLSNRLDRQLNLLTDHLSEKTMATATTVMSPANEAYAAHIVDDLTTGLLALLRAVRQGTEPPLIPASFVSAAATIALQATIWSAQPISDDARSALLGRIAFPALNLLNFMATVRFCFFCRCYRCYRCFLNSCFRFADASKASKRMDGRYIRNSIGHIRAFRLKNRRPEDGRVRSMDSRGIDDPARYFTAVVLRPAGRRPFIHRDGPQPFRSLGYGRAVGLLTRARRL
jgi:hypothetical protein